MQRLTCGHYLGDVVRRETVADVVLTETRYSPRQRLPLHSHERAYMCLVRRGGYTEHFAAHTREVGPSTLACHPPNERHAQQFHDAEVRSFNLEFSPTSSDRWGKVSAVLRQPAEYRGGPVIHLAERLYREFSRPDPFSHLAIEGLTLELLAEVGRLGECVTARRPPLWLNHVREALNSRFDESPTLVELGRLVGIHPVHLAITFRRHIGCTIGEYLRNCRVEYARRRLSNSDTSLATIALEAGFADQSHFNRVFRRLTGFTPAQYRRTTAGD